jgi:hypothetical protein
VPSGFTVVDLTAQCEVRSVAHYTYPLLEQIEAAAELIGFCSGQLWQSPEEFDVCLPPSLAALALRWRSVATTAGILSVRSSPAPAGSAALSLSLLAGGVEPEADRLTLQTFQQHVVRQLHDTPFEPAFDLLHLWQRPLLATLALSPPAQERDRWAFALIDRCFAASFFRRIGLI